MSVVVKVVRCGPVAVPMPRYATADSAGLDLHAALEKPLLLEPGARQLVPTGLRLQLPSRYEAQVRPRSGLALRHGVTVLNSPGTIDADFRGEIGIVLINHGQLPFTVAPLERIAQLVVAPVVQVRLGEADELDETARGSGGYGSTGVS